MEGRLFEDLVVSRAAGTSAHAAGVPFSVAVHAAAMLGLIALSVAAPDDLPATAHGRIPDIPGGVIVHAAPAPAGPARRPATRRSAPAPRLDALPAEGALPDETPFEDWVGPAGEPGTAPGAWAACPAAVDWMACPAAVEPARQFRSPIPCPSASADTSRPHGNSVTSIPPTRSWPGAPASPGS